MTLFKAGGGGGGGGFLARDGGGGGGGFFPFIMHRLPELTFLEGALPYDVAGEGALSSKYLSGLLVLLL